MRWWKRNNSKTRCYAKLDSQGRCLALWRLDSCPEGQHWVEVKDLDSRQIGLTADQLTPVSGYCRQPRGFQLQAQRAPACSRMAT